MKLSVEGFIVTLVGEPGFYDVLDTASGVKLGAVIHTNHGPEGGLYWQWHSVRDAGWDGGYVSRKQALAAMVQFELGRREREASR